MVTPARGAPTEALRRRAAVVIGLLALALLPEAVEAHATLARALPPARSVVRVPPKQVQLWFSEPLEPAYSSFSLWKDRAQVEAGKATVSADDRRLLAVAVPRLGRGVYVVRYRVLSVDGHIVEGTYSFTVRDEAARK